jgi:hypothetical protein
MAQNLRRAKFMPIAPPALIGMEIYFWVFALLLLRLAFWLLLARTRPHAVAYYRNHPAQTAAQAAKRVLPRQKAYSNSQYANK